MIQHHNFPDGGFVLHQLPIGPARRASAWFAADGTVLDVDVFTRAGQFRNGSRTHYVQAARYGRIYAGATR